MRAVHRAGRIVTAWTRSALRRLLDDVRSGAVSPDDAVGPAAAAAVRRPRLRQVDHHRPLRQGLPEAVYGPGKTPEQCAAIVGRAAGRAGGGPVAADPGRRGPGRGRPWRANPGRRSAPARPRRVAAAGARPGAGRGRHRRHRRPAGGRRVRRHPRGPRLPARCCITDCGVAGVHRLLATADELAAADAVVVVAGMEGALASLVGGLTAARRWSPCRPASGYGASLEGVTALLAMLASCAAGLTVVGIDNGFGAACAVRPHPRPDPDGRADDDRRRGSTASPASPATWPSAPARRRRRPRRGARHARAPAGRRLGARGRAGPAGRDRRHPGHVVRAERPTVVRTHAHIDGLVEEARLPERVRDRALATFAAAGRGRGPAAPPAAGARSTSTRSAASTPSSTSSAPAPPSRCSASTRSGSSPVATGHGHGPHRPRHAAQPGAGGGRAAARARPPTASTCPSS